MGAARRVAAAGAAEAAAGDARMTPHEPDYVQSADTGTVEVQARDPERRALLKRMGARHIGFTPHYSLPCRDRADMARIFMELRDAGFAFVTLPYGWYPGSVFELLREEGLAHGPFTEIAWATGGAVLRENVPPAGEGPADTRGGSRPDA